jgi:hypothetical protein
VQAVHPLTLDWAVEELLKVDGSRTMKVRSGEHLAAIALTGMVGAPDGIDQLGGVDLIFRRSPQRHAWIFGDHAWAAVEVKSLPGPYRQAEHHQQPGDTFTTTFRSAAEVLQATSDTVAVAIDQLNRKVSGDLTCCRCVFLIIHPFDGPVVEAWDDMPIIGHWLPTLLDSVDLDLLCVLWHPGLLAWWSQENRYWTNVIVAADPDGRFEAEEADPWFRAEGTFLAKAGYTELSPWRFKLTAKTQDDHRD